MKPVEDLQKIKGIGKVTVSESQGQWRDGHRGRRGHTSYSVGTYRR